jgi:peptidoglycan/xylan/chitin deacetylase (PgdA/CDA1 family)
MHLYKTSFIFKKIYSSFIWDIPTAEKEIYLTFDDGPIPGVTDFVLEALEKYNAKATFFAVGHNIEKHPHVFERVVQGGHAIGNHTFNHLNGWKTDTHTYLDNIAKCDEMLDAGNQLSSCIKGGSQKLFRPPYGKLTREQSRLVRQHYKVIMWDVLTADYDNSLHKETCLKKTIKYTTKGSVVIFHDSFKAEKNMTYVLPRLLEYFSEQGYSFKAIL